MTAAWACGCLALAVGCLPGPPGSSRLRALAPRPDTTAGRARRHAPTAALVVVGALLGELALGPAGAMAAATVVVVARHRRATSHAAAAAAATAAELADALRRITDELRTGAHPAAALDGVRADGPLAGAVLAEAAAAARLGEDVSRALRRSAAAHPAAVDLARVADAWALAERHGIPLADLLGGAHADIAWRLQYGRRVQAQLAGPRATAAVLTALPAVGLLLGQLFGADPLDVLRDGVLGQLLLLVGAALTAAGFAWSDRILRAAVPR